MRWNGFWLFIIVIAILGAAVGFFAGWAKKNNRVGAIKAIIWGFVIFSGCFNFPLWSEWSYLEWTRIITTLSAYGIIAAGLYGTYGEDKGPFLYPRIFLFTGIGMLCRYIMEFGEVSNTYNFTLVNSIVYLFAVPVYTLLTYEFVDRQKNKEE